MVMLVMPRIQLTAWVAPALRLKLGPLCSALEQLARKSHPAVVSPITPFSEAVVGVPFFCFLYILIISSRSCLPIPSMACSSRFALSLRRVRCSPSTIRQAARPLSAGQARWKSEATTSATSEPHQPDAKGGVKGETAPAKTVKFTADSYVNRITVNSIVQFLMRLGVDTPSLRETQNTLKSPRNM